MSKLKKGLIQVYTGDGKGKTTAALGQALRAAGYGLKVYIIQFMKGSSSGELKIAEKLKPYITIEQFGKDTLILSDKVTQRDRDLAQAGLAKAYKLLKKGQYDLIILDEINLAVYFNLIGLEDVLTIIRDKPDEIELILTGRKAPQQIIDAADVVTEMIEIKHPYRCGIKARKGIEY